MDIGIQNLGDLPPCEGNRLLKVVLKSQHPERYKDIEVLFGGQTQLIIALDLPHHPHFGSIGQEFGPLKLQLSNGFPDSAFQHGKRNRSKILLFYREVEQRRSAVRFLQNRYQLDCFYRDWSHESYTFTMRHMVSGKFYWQAHERDHLAMVLHMVLNHYHKNHKTTNHIRAREKIARRASQSFSVTYRRN